MSTAFTGSPLARDSQACQQQQPCLRLYRPTDGQSPSDGSAFELRNTPWDASVLGCKTSEFVVSAALNDDVSNAVVGLVDRLRADGVEFCCGRVPADRSDLVLALQSVGFRFVETSLALSNRRLSTYSADPRFAKSITVRMSVPGDLRAIQEIAAISFRHGRFHEDPAIALDAANERYRNWVADLFDRSSPIIVWDSSDGIASFLAYQHVDAVTVDLLLGASHPDYVLSSAWFWNAVLERLKLAGVQCVQTTVSAANKRVLNLYSQLGFTIVETLIGLHWRPAPSDANLATNC